MGIVVDPSIHRKLGHLRRGLRLVVAGQGASWLVCFLVLAAAAVFVVDYGTYQLTYQHMTVLQRMAVALLALSVLTVALWRRLVRPLRIPLPTEELVLMVERRHPELADRLIGLLQFGQVGERRPDGTSQELAARMAADANRIASALSFNDVVRYGRLWCAAYALLAVGLASGLAGWRPDLAGLWFRRNVLFQDCSWPRETHLSLVGPPRLRIVRGAPVALKAKADPAYGKYLQRTPSLFLRFFGLDANRGPFLNRLAPRLRPAALKSSACALTLPD
jgi:hypothetical protein